MHRSRMFAGRMVETEKNDILVTAFFCPGLFCRTVTVTSSVLLAALIFLMSVINYILFCFLCVFTALLAIAGLFVSTRFDRARLYVTGEHIYSKSIFGGEKYISIDSIKLVHLTHFKTLVVVTDDTKICQSFVSNRFEVAETIKKIMKK